MVGPAVGGLVAGAGATGLPFLLIAIAAAGVMVPLTIAGARAAATARDQEVGYSESVELASSVGYGEPVPYGGRRTSAIRTALQRPGVVAAMGALVVSGAVSSVSQLLISGSLHHDGLSSGRMGWPSRWPRSHISRSA